MSIKRTPLFDIHQKYSGKMVDFAGFELPIAYVGIKDEHHTVRNNVGLFDVSHMGEIMINGEDAERFINYLVTNDISHLVNEQIAYTPMCYEDGGTVDDILVYKLKENNYLLVVNGANIDKDYEHIMNYRSGFEVVIDNQSDVYAQIAIQGPKVVKVLEKLVSFDLEEIKYYYFKTKVLIGDVECILSRTGYTGEDGFEIYINNDDATFVWELLMENGKEHLIAPCGLGARDTLRFEAGMPLYGKELSKDINPLEAGLNYFIKLDQDDFIGKEALATYKKRDNKRKIVGFELMGKGIPRHGYTVANLQGEEIGVVTTGYLSPTLEKSIGFALIKDEKQRLGDEIIINVRKKQVVAKIVSKKFLKIDRGVKNESSRRTVLYERS